MGPEGRARAGLGLHHLRGDSASLSSRRYGNYILGVDQNHLDCLHFFPAVQLIIGRFIIGFATLITGSVAPMWVMELASPKYRSVLSSSTVVSVPFASFLVACIILGTFDKPSDWAWRGVVLVSVFNNLLRHITLTQNSKGEAVPSILSLCLLPLVDESPRWLLAKGRREEVMTSHHI